MTKTSPTSPVTTQRKKIKYWIQFVGLIGMDKIINISEEEYRHPKSEILFPIPKVMSFMGEDETLSPVNTTILLVFRFRERMRTELIYEFAGYE